MPLISPALAPPTAKMSSVTAEPSSKSFSSSTAKGHSKSTPTKVGRSPRAGKDSKQPEENANDIASRIPKVQLDIDVITDSIAAKLATSFLGHILFLKGQVPFPVLQLARLPGGKTNSRAAKQKRDLLDSFDIISSHLNTTFTALSTSLARSKSLSSTQADETSDVKVKKKIARVYMAILLGPSIGSAKTKVIFGVDGLEAKVWGERSDLPADVFRGKVEEVEDAEEADSQEESDDEVLESDEESGSDAEEPEDSDLDEDEEEEDEEEEDEQAHTESQQDDDSPVPPPTNLPIRPPTPPRMHTSGPKLMSVESHAEEQQTIRLADRLLSRTLASAEGEGHGMASEMAPTQTHILIRAPRRFNHPVWVPRQNLTKTLDAAVIEFLEEASQRSTMLKTHVNGSSKRNRHPVEGVWISSKRTVSEDSASQYEYVDVTVDRGPGDVTPGNGEVDEDDEMIWWSWDGKIVGFADW